MANMPTEEDIIYMQENIDDTLVLDIIICCAVCSAAAVLIAAVRFYARWMTVRKMILSDWMVVSSVVSIPFPRLINDWLYSRID